MLPTNDDVFEFAECYGNVHFAVAITYHVRMTNCWLTPLCLSVNGSWGPWSQWSVCSRTCNIGQRRRIRSCDSPAPSNGGLHCNYSGDSAVDVVNCKMDDCPNLEPSWSNWGSWSACSVTCSNVNVSTVSTRNRTCRHSTMISDCSGRHTDTTDCHLGHCPGSFVLFIIRADDVVRRRGYCDHFVTMWQSVLYVCVCVCVLYLCVLSR